MTDQVGVRIREGKREDLPAVLELVKELAEYEKALHEVNNTIERIEADGFGEHPVFGSSPPWSESPRTNS